LDPERRERSNAPLQIGRRVAGRRDLSDAWTS
jgi:hypothetical protein